MRFGVYCLFCITLSCLQCFDAFGWATEGHPACKKLMLAWLSGMVICLEQGADLHMAHLLPLPLTVCCFSKIQIGFTFLVPAYPGSPGKRATKRLCVCITLPLAHSGECLPLLLFFSFLHYQSNGLAVKNVSTITCFCLECHLFGLERLLKVQ